MVDVQGDANSSADDGVKGLDPNPEAGIEEVDAARIEKIYK
jgi:hypothetical protein